MRPKNYMLQIDNPCAEPWKGMSPDDAGRFCTSCSKSVIDFSKLSDKDIVQYLEQAAGKKLCGRFTATQLNRVLATQQQPRSFRIPQVFAGLVLLGSADNASASALTFQKTSVEKVCADESIAIHTIAEQQEQPGDSLKNVVRGKVQDLETGEFLPFVRVFVKNTASSALTNIDGDFTLVIPDSLLTDTITLRVSFIDYLQDVTIQRAQLPLKQTLLIQMTERQPMLGIVEIKKRKWWQRRFKD